MKIGILTFHWAHNYGAVLQAYALLSKLKEMGHDAHIIDRRPDYTTLPRWIYHHTAYKHVWGWLRFDRSAHQLLQPRTARFETQASFRRHFSDYGFDAVIVGSDQIWRWNWRMIGLNYFLDFLPADTSVRRIAYAASFGVAEWNSGAADTARVRQLLQQFNAVSVREQSGVQLCHDVFGMEARLTLDPTLLHDRTFYERLLPSENAAPADCRVVSIMLARPDAAAWVRQWAARHGWRHTELANTFPECPRLTGPTSAFHLQHVSVPEWLATIRSARLVITNSFHATVFSLLFGKPFVTLNSAAGGTGRLETLLGYVGLTERLIPQLDEARIDALLAQPIDYPSVHQKLQALRPASLQFLEEALTSTPHP